MKLRPTPTGANPLLLPNSALVSLLRRVRRGRTPQADTPSPAWSPNVRASALGDACHRLTGADPARDAFAHHADAGVACRLGAAGGGVGGAALRTAAIEDERLLLVARQLGQGVAAVIGEQQGARDDAVLLTGLEAVGVDD